MTISYPLTLPAPSSIMRVDFGMESLAGETESPYSFVPQTFVWNADRWSVTVAWAPMARTDADDVEGFAGAMRGREGSVLIGDGSRAAVLGTWLGQSPLVNGASQSGYTLAIDGLTPTTTTGAKGDYFQLGSGSNSRLHRLTVGFTANGSGQATLDIWPSLRGSPADNAALTLASAKGLFKLNTNIRRWTIQDALDSGISMEFIEDLRGL